MIIQYIFFRGNTTYKNCYLYINANVFSLFYYNIKSKMSHYKNVLTFIMINIKEMIFLCLNIRLHIYFALSFIIAYH